MEITEAYQVLEEYYTKSDLRFIYIKEKFDGSEYDSYKKLDYNAKLLREIARKTSDKEEQRRCFAAADTFEREANKGRSLM